MQLVLKKLDRCSLCFDVSNLTPNPLGLSRQVNFYQNLPAEIVLLD